MPRNNLVLFVRRWWAKRLEGLTRGLPTSTWRHNCILGAKQQRRVVGVFAKIFSSTKKSATQGIKQKASSAHSIGLLCGGHGVRKRATKKGDCGIRSHDPRLRLRRFGSWDRIPPGYRMVVFERRLFWLKSGRFLTAFLVERVNFKQFIYVGIYIKL
jgi:hypothetical protein